MSVEPHGIWADIQAIKIKSPLIHNITNYVVMEKTANALLSIGASPVMAHACEEVAEMTSLADSLVINIGTLSLHWVEAMGIALKTANTLGIPAILDPVGAGATAYRTETVRMLLKHETVALIRGNASEIAALQGEGGSTKGVDSLLKASDHIDQAMAIAKRHRCIVWMSGESDVITDGQACTFVDNGDPLMSKVTGMGCTATAIAGAFLAVNKNSLLATAHAAVLMGIAGEHAATRSKGPGSFNAAFFDSLYNITLKEIEERIRVRIP